MVESEMIITTTYSIEGAPASSYLGVVAGEIVMGINIFRDLFASVRNIVGGRASGYEKAIVKGRTDAIEKMTEQAEAMGADAIIGVCIHYDEFDNMVAVCATGTAVQLS